MKIRKNKLLLLILIFIQLTMICTPKYAVSAGEKKTLYCTKKITDITMGYYGQAITPYFTVYEENGVEYPVYCVVYEYGGITDSRSYNVTITGDYVTSNTYGNKIGVWRAIINGYPFKTAAELNCNNDYEAYAATKQAVFIMLYNRDVGLYTYDENDATSKRVYNAMKTIVENARASTQTQFDSTIDLTEGYWRYDESSKNLIKKITINSTVPIYKFDVNLKGNVPENTTITKLSKSEFEINVPLGNLLEDGSFEIEVQANVPAAPMFYGEAPLSNLQSYVLTTGQTKLATKTIEYLENPTKLIIHKKDIEDNNLEGVKFNVLDEAKNILYEGLETNENGIIELLHVVPGTYYVQEIEGLEGYEFNDDIIEIKVDFYEQQKTIVINEKIPEEPDVPEEPPKEPETPPDEPETPPEEPETPPEEPEIPPIEPEIPSEEPEIPPEAPTPEPPQEPEMPKEDLPKLPRTGF